MLSLRDGPFQGFQYRLQSDTMCLFFSLLKMIISLSLSLLLPHHLLWGFSGWAAVQCKQTCPWCVWAGGALYPVSPAVCNAPDPSSGAAVLCSTLLAGRLWTPLLVGHKLFLVVPQLLADGWGVEPCQELDGVRAAASVPLLSPEPLAGLLLKGTGREEEYESFRTWLWARLDLLVLILNCDWKLGGKGIRQLTNYCKNTAITRCIFCITCHQDF